MGRGTRTSGPAAPARAQIAADEVRARLRRPAGSAAGQPAWTSSRALPEMQIAWRQVDSSNVSQVAFRPARPSSGAPSPGDMGSVFIEFNRSGDERIVYRLDDVPYVVYSELLDAPSVGSYYNRHMKGQYQGDKIVGDALDAL